MAKSEEIASLSVSLALATDKFDKAITSVNKQIKQSERQFKEASKGLEGFENSFKGLDAKIQATSKQLDLYNQKLEVQGKKLNQVEKDYDSQKKKLDEIEKTLGKGSDEWKKQAELVQKTSDKYNKISNDIKTTQSNINRLNKDLKGSKDQFKALEDSLKGTGEEAETLSDKLSSIDKSTKLAMSEFNKLESALDDTSSEFDKLQVQLKKVGTELEGSKSKFKAYSNEIEALEQTLKDSKSEYDLLGQKIKALEKDLASSEKTFGSNSKEVNKLKKELIELKDTQNRVSSEIKNTSSTLNKLQTEANNTVSDVNRLGKEFKDLQSEINDLNTNKAIKEINKLVKEFKEAESEIKDFGENLKDMGESFSGISLGFTGIGAGAIASAIETDNAMGKIQASLGLTSKEAEETKERVQDLAQNGFNFTDTLDSITKVEQAMGDMLDPRQVDDLVAELQVFENYFEADVQDSIKAVSSMMRNFGITGQEATDVIAKGFQIGLNASDDWLDTLWEYGVQFADLGLTADDTLKLIANGMESGAFNTDKLADALKEGKIRLLEMGKESASAIEGLGLNAEKVQKNIATGGEVARNQIIKLAKEIMKIEDPIKQNATSVAIFGTMFEDLGIEAVQSIAMINENMIESKGTADQVRESYEETFGAKLTGMIERIKEPLAEIGKVFLDILEPIIAFAGHIAEVISLVPGLDLLLASFIGIIAVISPLITLIANMTITFGTLSSVLGGGISIAGVFSGILGTLSGVFTTIATFVTGTLIPAIVSLVSTFGLPIAIIGAVIGAGYLLVKNWDMVKEGAKALGEWINKTFNSIKENVSKAMSQFIQTGKDNIKRLSSDLLNGWNNIKNTCATKWNEISNTITQAISNFVKTGVDNVKALYNDLKTQFNNIKDTCSRVFSKIGEILVAPFKSAKKTIDSIIGGISSGISKVTGWLGGKGKSISIDTKLNTPQVASSFDDLQVQSSSMLRSGSITDSLKDLSSNLNKLDYYSNRYRASSDNNIARSVSSNNSNSDIKNELKEQNNLLTQLLNVMQNNNSDSGIHLNIENFNNNRNIDIKTLYEELEYYKYQSKLARGGV